MKNQVGMINKNGTLAKKLNKINLPLLLMLLPGVICLVVMKYIPMAGIIVAFKNVSYNNTIWNAPWVGFENFKFLFSTPDAWLITKNTIVYNLIFIVGGTILHVGGAVLLSELTTKRLSKFYQNVLFLPYLFSMVIVTYLVYGFMSKDFGLMNNSILPLLGIDAVDWYNKAEPWPFILCFVHFWKGMGYGCIMYIASIAGIDKTLYEAAEIDGASRWQRIKNVTIPSISTLIIIQLIMAVGKIFNSDFGLFYNVPMNSPVLFPVTQTLDTYVYRALLQTGDVGMSAAAAFYQSVVGFFVIIFANWVVTKYDSDKAMF